MAEIPVINPLTSPRPIRPRDDDGKRHERPPAQPQRKPPLSQEQNRDDDQTPHVDEYA